MNLVLLKNNDFISERYVKIGCKDPRYIHIKKILKLDIGSTFKAGIMNVSKGIVSITSFNETSLEGFYTPNNDKSTLYPIHLVIGTIRPIVMKRLLKDIISMGISYITVFHSENSEKSYLKSKFWHTEYEQSIEEGLSQSVSVFTPKIHLANSLKEAIHQNPYTTNTFILDPYANDIWNHESFLPSNYPNKTTIIIGSERGFTDNERTLAIKNNFLPIRLTSNILRTETACIASLSLAIHAIQYSQNKH